LAPNDMSSKLPLSIRFIRYALTLDDFDDEDVLSTVTYESRIKLFIRFREFVGTFILLPRTLPFLLFCHNISSKFLCSVGQWH
jgi:hypothetical protein